MRFYQGLVISFMQLLQEKWAAAMEAPVPPIQVPIGDHPAVAVVIAALIPAVVLGAAEVAVLEAGVVAVVGKYAKYIDLRVNFLVKPLF